MKKGIGNATGHGTAFLLGTAKAAAGPVPKLSADRSPVQGTVRTTETGPAGN